MIKSNNFFNLLFTLMFLVCFNSFSQDNQEKRPPKEKWSLVTMEGTVNSINRDTREITVMGPKGNLESFTAEALVLFL